MGRPAGDIRAAPNRGLGERRPTAPPAHAGAPAFRPTGPAAPPSRGSRPAGFSPRGPLPAGRELSPEGSEVSMRTSRAPPPLAAGRERPGGEAGSRGRASYGSRAADDGAGSRWRAPYGSRVGPPSLPAGRRGAGVAPVPGGRLRRASGRSMEDDAPVIYGLEFQVGRRRAPAPAVCR